MMLCMLRFWDELFNTLLTTIVLDKSFSFRHIQYVPPMLIYRQLLLPETLPWPPFF